ncbi:Asp-tRNA(Asn)/Glu-tRNA(Gln) amidotransferase subunit GatA [Clostridium facile]|uniref:Glutamyl-tRNA(Gln) amidotransferase subunit A n=1 Tax=Clostridium facile TaxID=2763035 RepID=A0ABR7IPG2_9CLOT|nr:Asp-tRNA(Asn)/Glu-tRNA(Gln) amidotransferase subunit GatA [Clostridium facile]MBC5787029.1 Asp-tRNA(Asn)/Glu-tRNA(Gln) amidotransferase subunit GatA [Clostridium facile]
MELYQLSATELGAMLAEKKCSAEEITNSVFDRIDKVEDKVNAYVTLCKEQAVEKAKAVDAKIAAGEQLSPLAGIPVGIKDNICTKDVLTSCSSKMLYNFVPPYNATVIDKLNQQDFVMTGKLNMDEFAMGSSTETSYFKKTCNPHDLTKVPGGSSGGSAAAVAAGECPIALGSDTGGSIRQPSSFCGVVGLKPTYGSVSRYGLVAFASSLDQIGPLGRTVDDVALLYSAICGWDKHDATSEYKEYPDFRKQLNPDMKGLKIAVPKEYFGAGIDEEVKASVMNAVKELEKQGATVSEISLPGTDYALSAYYIISSAEASSNLARFDGVKYGYRSEHYNNLIEMYENTRSEGFGDEVKRRIMLGTFVLSSGYYDAYYKRAKFLQRQIAQEFETSFQQYDLIVTPTVPCTAFHIGQNIDDPLKMYANDICTVTVNIAGLPAINIPCGKDVNGMPIGMQMIGKHFSEQTLLNTAKCYENIVGGFGQIPELN